LSLDEPIPALFNKGCWATIDPGDHTAVQLWINGKPSMLYTKYDMIKNLDTAFLKSVCMYNSVIIESVELWSGSLTSYTSATRGDLFKLAYVIGGILSALREIGSDRYVVSPRKWKGQLDYHKLRHILKVKFGFEARNDHEASARGMGLWAKGIF
jgi:hypothetical protein